MEDLRYQNDLLTALNQKLSQDEKMYRLIADTSSRAILYIQEALGSVRILGKWDKYFDFRPQTVEDLLKVLDQIDDDYRDEILRLYHPENLRKIDYTCDCKLKDNDVWLTAQCVIHYDTNGNVTERIISFSDITSMHNYREELRYMAYYDFMTGLYNRNYFITQLSDFINKAKEENCIVSVVLIDIDDFHKINDSLGILIGDEIVQNVGMMINEFTDKNIIGARFDADIFCLAIYDPVGTRSVDNVYQKLKSRFSSPILLTNGSDVTVTVSVGVAEFPEAGDNALLLINDAEIVMLKAKDAGKNTIKYFDASVLEEFHNRIQIENKLKEAVHEMKFFMNYQPQYNIDGTLRGVEALIRWRDHEGKMIPPAAFIPIAEQNGSIVSIGDFVLEESLRECMEWKRKYNIDMIMSVNISAIQYRRHDFVSRIISLLRKYEMPANLLELEITESVLIDDFKSVVEKMEELRDYGIRVSIDDFGTGYSSLSYLKGLPVDTIKIDKSFIDTVLTNVPTKVITECIIQMSKKLGYEIVAEGVETVEQYDALRDFGCDIIQGYYLGKPMPCEQIEELLLRLM